MLSVLLLLVFSMSDRVSYDHRFAPSISCIHLHSNVSLFFLFIYITHNLPLHVICADSGRLAELNRLDALWDRCGYTDIDIDVHERTKHVHNILEGYRSVIET